MRNILFFFSFLGGIVFSQTKGTLTDSRDGKIYKTVVIGAQTWMAENLNVSTFRNGDNIPEAKTNEEWNTAGENGQPAWCYYDFDSNNGAEYGKLYNWFAVTDLRGLAPFGWHTPNLDEWNILRVYIGSDYELKLKAPQQLETIVSYKDVGGYYETKWVECSNCNYWTENQKANNPCPVCRNKRGKSVQGKYIPKTKKRVEVVINRGWDGIDQYGFHAIPGGTRGCESESRWEGFHDLETGSYFWSTTPYDDNWAEMTYFMSNNEHYWTVSSSRKEAGLSIRCIKD
jgi:uncharacterized protein (TIGR02145 family)